MTLRGRWTFLPHFLTRQIFRSDVIAKMKIDATDRYFERCCESVRQSSFESKPELNRGRLLWFVCRFPPFLEFGRGQSDLFGTEGGVGFDLVDDFFGPLDITAVAGVGLGQFQP